MTASPNGIGHVEAAVLDSLLAMRSTPGVRHRTSTVLAHIADRSGIHPRYAWSAIVAMAQPWLVSLPLLVGYGNFGSPIDSPADPRYTEVGLSRLGRRVALAALGDGAALPVGLVVGDTYAGGSRPPFDPQRTIAALRLLHGDPGVSDALLHEALGDPSYPTGCLVEGPVDRLLEGQAVELRLSARFELVGPTKIEISGFPHLEDGIYPEDFLERRPPAGLRGLRNESRGGDLRYLAGLSFGADADAIIGEWRERWPMCVEVRLDLGRPWRALATDALSSMDGVDLDAHLSLLVADDPRRDR